MRLLANMNISPGTVDELRRRGWDVLRISDLLPANAADEIVLDKARSEGRVLISQDLDFSRLLALAGYRTPSLITVRMARPDPEMVAARLCEVLPALDRLAAEGWAVTIEDSRSRMRQLPIQPA